MGRTGSLLFVLMVSMLETVPVLAADVQPVRIAVRLAGDIVLPRWVLASAQDIVSRIYRRAGVEVRWADSPGGDNPALLLTVILNRDAPARSMKIPDVLAVAVSPDTGCGRVAYVSWPRIQSFAEANHVMAPNVLGRVMAHELGHLLLRQHAHSDAGIMRAHWNRVDFAGIDDRAAFTSAQSALIRDHILQESSAAAP